MTWIHNLACKLILALYSNFLRMESREQWAKNSSATPPYIHIVGSLQLSITFLSSFALAVVEDYDIRSLAIPRKTFDR